MILLSAWIETAFDLAIIGMLAYILAIFVGFRRHIRLDSSRYGLVAVASGLSAIAIFFVLDLAQLHLASAHSPMKGFLGGEHSQFNGLLIFISVGLITLGLRAASIVIRQLVENLRQSEARFQDVAEVAGDWIWEMDSNLRFTYLSDRYYDLTGVPRGLFEGKTRREIAGEAALTEDWRSHLEDLENHKPFRNFEYTATLPDGRIRHYRSSGKPVFDEGGAFKGYRGMASDITDLKNAAKALRNSEARFWGIVDHSPASIVLKGLDGRFQAVNKSFLERFSVTEEDVLGKTSAELFPGGHGDEIAAHDREVTESGVARELEIEPPQFPGHVFQYSAVPVFDGDGDVSGVLAIGLDVTAQKASDAAVRRSAAQTKLLMDALPALITYVDNDLRYVTVNQTTETWLVKPSSQLIGKRIQDVLGETQFERLRPHLEDALSGRRAVFANTVDYPDGVTRDIDVTYVPDRDEAGQVQGLFTLTLDVTDRKRAELEIAEKSALLQTILDAVPLSVTLRDREGRYVFVNKWLTEIYGGKPEDYIGKTGPENHGVTTAPPLRGLVGEVLETEQAIYGRELEPPTRPGHTHRYSSVPVFEANDDVSGVLTIGQDVTAQIKTEEALRKSEAQFSGILRIAPEAIITTDSVGKILMFNDAAEKIFGYKFDDMIGRPLDILLPEFARKAHGGYLKSFTDGPDSACLMGGRGEISGRRCDGSIFPAEASISKLQLDGETILTVTMHDITERRNAEAVLHVALEEAQQADKIKQDFMANMSHELRTPLNAIMGFSEVMEMEIFGPIGNDHYSGYIQDISSSSRHLLALVNDMLDISKIEAGMYELYLEHLDLGDIAAEAVRELSVLIEKKDLQFDGVRDQYPETVYADSNAVRRILVNLLSNAVKFTPEGGRIGVSITPSNGDFVGLEVWDTGIGIAAGDIGKVLAPYTQIRHVETTGQGGTGLGLSIIKLLAEEHGGSVTVESTIGVGTHVKVHLPKTARSIPRAARSA